MHSPEPAYIRALSRIKALIKDETAHDFCMQAEKAYSSIVSDLNEALRAANVPEVWRTALELYELDRMRTLICRK